ncbi:hypothetical protein BUALT_Bualt06G0021500 [Buddleja alternifolia]|uniref:Senescence-associated protein n=1 Tax=Buddleja alternifolia TaxID=168488 RepID=A0AAV6XCC4_9LAMI|nr:hypothetical protein BUALT_Bualt06G0021500 [Buddleja alternifolia]
MVPGTRTALGHCAQNSTMVPGTRTALGHRARNSIMGPGSSTGLGHRALNSARTRPLYLLLTRRLASMLKTRPKLHHGAQYSHGARPSCPKLGQNLTMVPGTHTTLGHRAQNLTMVPGTSTTLGHHARNLAKTQPWCPAANAACPPRGLGQRHVPLGARGPLLRVGKRTAGKRVASSLDSDLEAFSHNPAHVSFAPLAFQLSAMTNCANQRFLSYKGSLGHAFTVHICTGNQNQMSFYPSIPHEIFVLVELILGHLHYLLTDVLPQPNSLPDNVSSLDWPAEAPKEAVPSPSPGRQSTTRSHSRSSSSSSPTADEFGTGTLVPSPQSQSFSRGHRSILPTSLAYIVPSTRGCSPWRPDAVMSTTGRGRHSVFRIFKGNRGRIGHHATCGVLPAAGPYLRMSHFQGGQAVKQKR